MDPIWLFIMGSFDRLRSDFITAQNRMEIEIKSNQEIMEAKMKKV
jgi:hypothetical protein